MTDPLTPANRPWRETGGPVIVLVEPQLGENIGTVARAMANFGLRNLRLVNPRDGWPNEKAVSASSGATMVLDAVTLFDTLEDAIADLHLVFATTARAHFQVKTVVGPKEAATLMQPPVSRGERVGVVFGRERNGLESQEVGLADVIITLPVNPAFSSLNLAQAVLLIAYEWFTLATDHALPFVAPDHPAAEHGQQQAFFTQLETELARVEYFRPPEKRDAMMVALRNIFLKMRLSHHDLATLQGVVTALAQGEKGPASGGIMSSEEAQRLRDMLVDQTQGREPGKSSPVRGLARLVRRNPTAAERKLWAAMVNERRLTGAGFKRSIPIGPHVADIVSFPHRVVIDLAQDGETPDLAQARTARQEWLRGRNYQVLAISADDIEHHVEAVLERIIAALKP